MMKKIEINNKTDFKTIMYNANCETSLNREMSEVKYFKVKINKKWSEFKSGDFIFIDENYNMKEEILGV